MESHRDHTETNSQTTQNDHVKKQKGNRMTNNNPWTLSVLPGKAFYLLEFSRLSFQLPSSSFLLQPIPEKLVLPIFLQPTRQLAQPPKRWRRSPLFILSRSAHFPPSFSLQIFFPLVLTCSLLLAQPICHHLNHHHGEVVVSSSMRLMHANIWKIRSPFPLQQAASYPGG